MNEQELLEKLLPKIKRFLLKQNSGFKIHVYDLCRKYNLHSGYATPLASRLSNTSFITVYNLDTPSPFHHEIIKT
jgi:hypothetical protein